MGPGFGDAIWKGLVGIFVMGCIASAVVGIILWNIAVWLYHHVQISWGWA